ncbi:hypothetical protein L2E82_03648 [Cichorium intybus]|uniref:Uncharacterized protein n=1 Tax=Cichorium intybus TaxID=13427 RepID=A0ACB9H3W4_CICIN|nr:hypothetical protein L2E82_03648 [Cichorium intybus]
MEADERKFVDIFKGAKKKEEQEGESKKDDRKKDEGAKGDFVEVEDDCFEITVIPNAEDGEAVKKTLIGEVKSFDLLQNIFDMPRAEGLFNIKLNFIGGMFVSLEFEKKELAVEFLEKARPVWSNWFDNLFKWQHNFKISSRLASIVIFGIPLHIWNTDVAEEIVRLWGTLVSLYNEEKVGLNKGVRRVGILTSEEPWIDDYVIVNVQGKCYKVRVVEDPIWSFGLVPNCSNMEQGQSSDEEWWDTDNEERGNKEQLEESDFLKNWESPEEKEVFQSINQQARSEESIIRKERGMKQNYKEDETVAKKHSEAGQGQAGEGSGFTNFGLQSKNEPNPNSPKSKSKSEEVGGPIQKDLGVPVVPDLNNSPSSLGYFLFIENDENLEDKFDLGDEIEIEQEINKEIERKRRNKKKGQENRAIDRWE